MHARPRGISRSAHPDAPRHQRGKTAFTHNALPSALLRTPPSFCHFTVKNQLCCCCTSCWGDRDGAPRFPSVPTDARRPTRLSSAAPATPQQGHRSKSGDERERRPTALAAGLQRLRRRRGRPRLVQADQDDDKQAGASVGTDGNRGRLRLGRPQHDVQQQQRLVLHREVAEGSGVRNRAEGNALWVKAVFPL